MSLDTQQILLKYLSKLVDILTKVMKELQKQTFCVTAENVGYDVTKKQNWPFGSCTKLVYFPFSLTYLNLARNLIHSLPKNVFRHLTNLKVLDVSHNQIQTIDSGCFTGEYINAK